MIFRIVYSLLCREQNNPGGKKHASEEKSCEDESREEASEESRGEEEKIEPFEVLFFQPVILAPTGGFSKNSSTAEQWVTVQKKSCAFFYPMSF